MVERREMRSAIPEMIGTTAPLLSRRKSLAEEAAETLRTLILLEKLEPGAPIPERDLAEALGVSRTPLREAMRTLESEGLVEYSETRRPRVAAPSLEELAHDLSVLGALEGLAGEQACARAQKSEIDAVATLCRKMLETSDTSPALEFFETDMQFHCAIVQASHNPSLIQTHRQYNARLWRARFISSRQRPNRPRTLDQHQEIASALVARDAVGSAAALREHLQTALTNISDAFEEEAAQRAAAGDAPSPRVDRGET